jgi:hypothetical protein
MAKTNSGQEITYHIRLKGGLNPSLAEWFENITIQPEENGETLLVGQFVDQPALRGLLEQLWNLNITVLSVERVVEPSSQDSHLDESKGDHE